MLVACGCATPQQSPIEAVAAALGGAERIRGLEGFAFHGTGAVSDASQAPAGSGPAWMIVEYVRTVDLVNVRSQVRQVRVAEGGATGERVQRLTENVDGDVAWNITPDGRAARAPAAAAGDRRIDRLHHPITIVREALDPMATISNVRIEGAGDLMDVMDVTTRLGEVVTLVIDRTTHLPARVISVTTDVGTGEGRRMTTFSGYNDVGDFKMPYRLVTTTANGIRLDLEVSDYFVQRAIAGLTAPESVK
jgi:hypothetical protein